MKNVIKIQARAYTVQIKDTRTGEQSADQIVLSKDQLQAGGLIGMSDEDIICRIYNRQGYRVLEIGTPRKKELTVDLGELLFAEDARNITDRVVIQEGGTNDGK